MFQLFLPSILILLSISNTHIKSLDKKSMEYVDKMLDKVEERYSGKRVAHFNMPNTPKEISVKYYDKIPTAEKIYSKHMKVDTHWVKNYTYIKRLREEGTTFGDYKLKSKMLEDDTNIEFSSDESASPKVVFNRDSYYETSDEMIYSSEEEPLEKEGEGFVMVGDQKYEADNSRFDAKVLENQTNYSDAVPISERSSKVYDRRFKEQIDTEDIKLAMFRKKNRQMYHKITRDLFLLSGSGSRGMQHALGLNSSKINDSRNDNPFIKAWGVLFHFRNKSLHSALYDEVDNILARHHSNIFYQKFLDVALKRDYHYNFFPKCTVTGWKVDVLVSQTQNSKNKFAIKFFQKEDVIYNIEKGKDEPIGIQKLVLKQLENMSNMKIISVYESDLNNTGDKTQFEYLDRLISQQFMKMQK